MFFKKKVRRYNVVRDIPDVRDFKVAHANYDAPEKLPDAADLRVIANRVPEIWDQEIESSCFPADTRIRLADGSQKAIEKLLLGEAVVTAEGNTGYVRNMHMRPFSGELIHLWVYGNNLLHLTPEHPVLTRRGYVKASEIVQEDFIALTKYAPANITECIETLEFITAKEAYVTTGERKYGHIPGRSDRTVILSNVPEKIEITPRLGKLIGLFLAEGSTHGSRTIWTFGSHEFDTLVPETVELLTDLGVKAEVQPRPNNSINVSVYGKAWARLFERLCGNGSGRKILHPIFHQATPDVKEQILSGWLAGDGYRLRRKGRQHRTEGSTVSHDLALGMFDLGQSIGLQPSIKKRKAVQNKYAKARRDFYIVGFTNTPKDNYRSPRICGGLEES